MTVSDKKLEVLEKARAASAAQRNSPEVESSAPVATAEAETQIDPVAAESPLNQQEHVPVPKPEAVDAMPKTASMHVLEVELQKDYAPEFIEDDMGKLVLQGEVKIKVPRGTTIKLPTSEATRAMRLGIAIPTAGTFGDER